MRWFETDKGDPRGRELADRHYTRVAVGHPMWTRPGWNQVLLAEQKNGRRAVFVWWRPKWEDGRPGTARKDGLRCIECTIFRNETRFRSSELIVEAVGCLLSWVHALDVEFPDGIITAVNSAATEAGRSEHSAPGHCFRCAGFEPFEHSTRGRADLWLRYTRPLPPALVPEKTARLMVRQPLPWQSVPLW